MTQTLPNGHCREPIIFSLAYNVCLTAYKSAPCGLCGDGDDGLGGPDDVKRRKRRVDHCAPSECSLRSRDGLALSLSAPYHSSPQCSSHFFCPQQVCCSAPFPHRKNSCRHLRNAPCVMKQRRHQQWNIVWSRRCRFRLVLLRSAPATHRFGAAVAQFPLWASAPSCYVLRSR